MFPALSLLPPSKLGGCTFSDSSKPPSPFGSWPYNGSTSHPNPTECNAIAGATIFTLQDVIVSDLHILIFSHLIILMPARLISCHPPHYSFDRARYDHDKANNHSSGCPNHTCRGENASAKIEEQKPGIAPKPKESDSTSLIKLPNHPFSPLAWVPHNLLKEKDADKNSESQPGIWNGWIPLDINSLRGLMQDGEDKKGSPNEDEKSRFPWPIIWMPGYNKPEEAVKDFEGGQQQSKSFRRNAKI
ncbi:putative BAG family molecular chaperone regulator 6 [Cocos nucifera]|uniref:Putative BAG family molecular chaperone regulator 6 n=1 Tax=Cocos nucifera TaxID=13894 RepID=A0A8K0I3H5_COCNU|nr:putative BAG family molecular chaperone regulator 6 [Cocos nucifera]